MHHKGFQQGMLDVFQTRALSLHLTSPVSERMPLEIIGSHWCALGVHWHFTLAHLIVEKHAKLAAFDSEILMSSASQVHCHFTLAHPIVEKNVKSAALISGTLMSPNGVHCQCIVTSP